MILRPGQKFEMEVQGRCRICALQVDHAGALATIHDAYAQGTNWCELTRIANRLLAVDGVEPDPPIARDSLRRHCQKHLQVVTASLDAADGAPRDDYEVDYLELRKLYGKMVRLFDKFYVELSPEAIRKNTYEHMALLRMVSDLRATLKTLADMRNSEKLMGTILNNHTRQLIRLFSEPVGQMMRRAVERLRAGEDPQEVADWIEQLLAGDIYPAFNDAANRALEISRQQFGLH